MPFKKGQKAWNKGIPNSGFKRGYIPHNKGLRGYTNQGTFKKGNQGIWLGKKRPDLLDTNASKTMFKKGFIPWNKGIEWERMRGQNSPRWVANRIKHPDKRIRRSVDYVLWRTAVFIRDNYTCQKCKVRGGILQADHIKPFALFPELRFAIDNGRTLCLECHKQTLTYGKNIVKLKKIMSYEN